jgi:dihydropteroate synthase
MLILNLSPDSFSSDGLTCTDHRLATVLESLIARPPDILDIGAVSTRPGSQSVSPEEEWGRLKPACPLIKQFVQRVEAEHGRRVRISLDSSSPTTVERMGNEIPLSIINDVCAGQKYEQGTTTIDKAAREGLGMILMHMKGEPSTMQDNPTYTDCIQDVLSFLDERKSAALTAGVTEVWGDPGIGFGKTLQNNLDLLSPSFFQQAQIRGLDLCIGLSRKSFLLKWAAQHGHGMNWELPQRRDPLSKKWEFYAVASGARAIRTHVLPDCFSGREGSQHER